MDHIEKNYPSDQDPQQISDLESPETQESFRQNLCLAEKILLSSGIFPPKSDEHDIRKITREKVETMLYAKQLQVETLVAEDQRPGPAGINPWIWDNKVLPEIQSHQLKNYIHRAVNSSQFTFYSRYAAVKNLLRHVSAHLHVHSNAIRDEHFLDPGLYEYLQNARLKPPVNRELVQYLKKIRGNLSPFPSSRVDKELHPKIIQYQLHLQQKGYSSKHVLNCTSFVHELFKWLCLNIRIFSNSQPHNIAILQIKNDHLIAFRSFKLKQVKNAAISPITFCHFISSIRLFYYYLQREYGYSPPLRRFCAIKAPRYHPRDIPKDEEISRFFEIVDLYADDPIREQIGFRLMLELGLRLSETVKVTWRDINFGTRTIVIHSKGKKSHMLPLAGRLLHCLQLAHKLQPQHEFVLGTNSACRIYNSYKWYAMIAGWSYPGGVHFFRHIFVTKLAEQGIPPQILKELTRVNSLDTVSLYTHLGQHNQYLIDQINRLNFD